MRKLFYCGIEEYESRYSKQLTQWNVDAFVDHGWTEGKDFELVTGADLTDNQDINTGAVLDAHGRTYYSLTQIANLVAKLQAGEVTGDDVIFFEDMFTPGIESLPYIFDQMPRESRPKVYVRCLAQTIDPDDFVNKANMFRWMRPFEKMIDNFVDGILVASEEMISNLRIAGFEAPIYVTGLPFGKKEVLQRVKRAGIELEPLHKRKKQVVWASRWDEEKQPHFFMDLVERFRMFDNSVEFVICTGNKELRSNDSTAVLRANIMAGAKDSNLVIKTGLSKEQYYATLADSQVLFNCALQDWVSNTLSEADTLGCITIYPAYRSFPEALNNHKDHLYIPWSADDAFEKVAKALDEVSKEMQTSSYMVGKISDYQNQTIFRTIDVFEEKTTYTVRNGLDYRRHVAYEKY